MQHMKEVLREIIVLAADVRVQLLRSAPDVKVCDETLRVIEGIYGNLRFDDRAVEREQVLFLAARRMSDAARNARRQLAVGNVQEALRFVNQIVLADTDPDSLIQKKHELIRVHQEFRAAVPDILSEFVGPGMVVCELFHGENTDVLTMLADLVGSSGHVYGVDALNPFADNPEMVRINARDNVTLLRASFPSMPVPPLDALVVRELVWAYRMCKTDRHVRFADTAISGAIKDGGLLILLLSKSEYDAEVASGPYQEAVARFPGVWKRVSFKAHELVFRKQ